MKEYDYLVCPARYQYTPRTMTEAFRGVEYASCIHTYDKKEQRTIVDFLIGIALFTMATFIVYAIWTGLQTLN
jgi:hypothetical protein